MNRTQRFLDLLRHVHRPYADTRDPGRIPVVLQALEQAWLRHPDLRLGQVLLALEGADDAFVLEDDVWLARLRRLATTGAYLDARGIWHEPAQRCG